MHHTTLHRKKGTTYFKVTRNIEHGFLSHGGKVLEQTNRSAKMCFHAFGNTVEGDIFPPDEKHQLLEPIVPRYSGQA